MPMTDTQTRVTDWVGTTPTYQSPPDRDNFTFYDEPVQIDELGLKSWSVKAHSRTAGPIRNCVGYLLTDPSEYLEERCVATVDLPATYSSWTEDWPTVAPHLTAVPDKFIEDDRLYIGRYATPEPLRPNPGQHYIRSDLVEAALRLLNGAGRYATTDYTLHLALPFTVLEGPENHAVISHNVVGLGRPAPATIRSFEPLDDTDDHWTEFSPVPDDLTPATNSSVTNNPFPGVDLDDSVSTTDTDTATNPAD